MNTRTIALTMLASSLVFFGTPTAFAQEEQEADIQEEANLQEEIQKEENILDALATTAEGEAQVEQSIKDRFVVNDEIIESLRQKSFGYGEISTTLALAQQMDGGINEENVQKIVDLRTGESKAGWGTIAQQFNVDVSDLKQSAKQQEDLPAAFQVLAETNSSKAPNTPKEK